MNRTEVPFLGPGVRSIATNFSHFSKKVHFIELAKFDIRRFIESKFFSKTKPRKTKAMQFKQPKRRVSHQKQLLLCPVCKKQVSVVGGKMLNADSGKAHVCPNRSKPVEKPVEPKESKSLGNAAFPVLTAKFEPLTAKSDPLVIKGNPLIPRPRNY